MVQNRFRFTSRNNSIYGFLLYHNYYLRHRRAAIGIISTFYPELIPPPLPDKFGPLSEISNSSSADMSSSLSENVNVENTSTSIFNIYHKIVENIKNIFDSNYINSDSAGDTNDYKEVRSTLK